MNIKFFGYVILIAVLFSAGSVVLAQEKINSPVVSSTTIDISREQDRMQLIRNFAMKMGNRFDINIRTLTALSSRISSRINKLSNQGYDMTEAKAKFNNADAKIQEAKNALTNLQQGIDSAIASSQPKKAFVTVRLNLVKDVMDKVKSAHRALVDTIVILKKNSKGEEANKTATSTSATSTLNQ